MTRVNWQDHIRLSSGRNYELELYHDAVEMADRYPDFMQHELDMLENQSRFYIQGDVTDEQQRLSSELEEDFLTDWGGRKDITSDDYVEAGEAYGMDRDGDWINLQNNYDEGLASLFQSNNVMTLLGKTSAAEKRATENLIHRHPSLNEEFLAPTPEAKALAEEWSTISGSSIGEAMKDLFYRSWSSEDRKVMFKYDQPSVALTEVVDSMWTQEKKDKAWETLQGNAFYGRRMAALGMTKEDVDSTNNVDHLFFMINSRYEQTLASTIIAANENNAGFNNNMIWWKRFIVDNFVNDPDTAVELTAAAGTLSLGFFTGGTTWLGTAALVSRWGVKMGKGMQKSAAVHKAMAGLRTVKTGTLNLHKLLPTQLAGGFVWPTIQSMKQGEKLFPAMKWAYSNPSNLNGTQMLLGSGIEGGMAGFGAYFVNTSALIDINDQVYGEGKHGITWSALDLATYTGLGAGLGAALGTAVRLSMGAGNRFVVRPFFDSALNKIHKEGNGSWLINLNTKRKEYLIDWGLAEIGTPAVSRATLEVDGQFATVLRNAETDGYDFAGRVRTIYQSKLKRGLGEEDVKDLILRDIRDYKKSIASEMNKRKKGSGVVQEVHAENMGRVLSQDVANVLNNRKNGDPDTSSLDTDGSHVTRAKENADEVLRLQKVQQEESRVEAELTKTDDPAEQATLKERLNELTEEAASIRSSLDKKSDTWLIDDIQATRSNRVSQRMNSLRNAVTQSKGGHLTAPVMRHLIGEEDLQHTPEAAARIEEYQKGDRTFTKKEALDLIDEVEGEWRTNRYHIEDQDILEYTMAHTQEMGDELIRYFDEMKVAKQKLAAELGDPNNYELQTKARDVLLKENDDRRARVLGFQNRDLIPNDEAPAAWNRIKEANPEAFTTRDNGDEVLVLDNDISMIKTKEGKFVLEAVGNRIDDSADAVGTKETAPL